MLAFFILTPFAIRSLGVEAYGIWAFVYTLAFFIQMLDIGLSQATIKFISQYTQQQNTNKISNYLSLVFVFYLAIGLIVLTLGWLLTPILHLFFIKDTHQFELVIGIFQLGLMCVALNFPLSLFQSFLRARHEFLKVNIVAIITTLVYSSAIFY